MIQGRGWKVKVCLAMSLTTEPSSEWNLQRSRCVDRRKSQRRHWNIRYGSSIRSMWQWKIFGKELGNDDHIKMDHAVLISFGKIITKVFTRYVRFKYVVCSPTKVVLNLTELVSSTVEFEGHSILLWRKNYSKNFIALNIKVWFEIN